ncbi:MAG: hypothetical protein SFY66_08150 [Oculatellaceae cyanobacterium bins.114]|nr:hypothetical protein [Oculatellaceae cyanobacterium bins.114]
MYYLYYKYYISLYDLSIDLEAIRDRLLESSTAIATDLTQRVNIL